MPFAVFPVQGLAMATIKDVADLAGVTEKTAARALAGVTMGKRRDARERADRVRQAALKLGYEPSEIAKSLRQGKTNTIGLVIGSITNRYFASLTETLQDEAEMLGYRVVMHLTRWNDEKSVELMRHLRRLRVEGIFYASGFFPQERKYLAQLVAMRFPVIMLQHNDQGIPAVGLDHSESLLPAVRHLAARKHSEIRFVLWKTRAACDDTAKRLFRQACQRCGVRGSILYTEEFAVCEALAREKLPALICNAPNGIRLFFQTARTIPGYRPDMVGIYDEWNFADRPPELCGAILVQAERQIRIATRELIQQIEKDAPATTLSVQSRFHTPEQFEQISTKDLAVQHLVSY